MSNLSEINDERKRKSDFTMNRDLHKMNEEVVPQRATFESMRASEEQLKKRKILKIIRVGEAPNDEVPKGKFQFNFNPSLDQKTIPTPNKDSDTNDQGNKVQTPNLQTKDKELNLSAKKEEKSVDTAEPKEKQAPHDNFSNPFVKNGTSTKAPEDQPTVNKQEETNHKPLGSKQEGNLSNNPFFMSNKPSMNPFAKLDQTQSTAANNQTTKINPFVNYSKGDTLSNNPFLQARSNPTDSIFKTGDNPFSKSSGMKFNFNLAKAETNPNWNSDDEDEGQNVNPEEEVKIDEKENTNAKTHESIKSNSVRLYKRTLENLAEYNFTEKKYVNKGKGEFTLEFPKGEKLIGLAIYRNQVLSILFQGIIVPSVTSFEESMKNYKYYAVINKLLVIVDDKKQFKSIKLAFMSQKDLEDFKIKFNEVLKILKENNTSILQDSSIKEDNS